MTSVAPDQRRRCSALILLLLSPAFAEEAAILRPIHDTWVSSGPVSIVAKGSGELRLDGKVVKSERPAAGVVTATVTPSAGSHELSLGSAKITFWYGSGKPALPEFKTHPPAGSCDACHAVKEGAWEIKGGSAGDNCLACHDRAAFIKLHQHNPDVLQDCQVCHFPHGSAVKSHLKMKKEIACKQCHG